MAAKAAVAFRFPEGKTRRAFAGGVRSGRTPPRAGRAFAFPCSFCTETTIVDEPKRKRWSLLDGAKQFQGWWLAGTRRARWVPFYLNNPQSPSARFAAIPVDQHGTQRLEQRWNRQPVRLAGGGRANSS